MDLKQLRSNCQHLSLGNFTWTKKQSEKHILQNSGHFIKAMFKCIFFGTPQTIVYAMLDFLRYFDFCLSLFTLFWFLFEFSVIRLDMYISWHLMLPNHFLSTCCPLHIPTLTQLWQDFGHIYLCGNQLDVSCLQAHYPFYLHCLWTYSQ